MTERDLVTLALSAIGAGATAGAGAITAGLFFLRLSAPLSGGKDVEPAFVLLAAALLVGIVVAIGVTWTLTRIIQDYWRRGVATAIATFAALMLGAATPFADLLGGATGLFIYLVVLVGLAARAAGRARRAAAE